MTVTSGFAVAASDVAGTAAAVALAIAIVARAWRRVNIM